jgi:cytochrome c oxidase subunit 4
MSQSLLLAKGFSRLSRQAVVATRASSHAVAHHDEHHDEPLYKYRIGKREIVGYGFDGNPEYADSILYPYPAIRFKEPDAKYNALHEKELKDWKSLSVADKKALYRTSYCQTWSEMFAPTGNWKTVTGLVLAGLSLALWTFIGLKQLYPPLPESFTDEARLAQLKRMIDLRVGHVDGLSSKWDYENGRWKE